MTRFLHLGFKDRSNHRHTTTTPSSSFGFGLDLGQFGHTAFDTSRDGTFRDVLIISFLQ
jgi:hypothetical protein